jgi:3-oxoacyl-[acyl-carrier protein] reductase
MIGLLAEKIALVTGASRGLGKAVALGFAAEGADIVVNYLQDSAAAEVTAEAIRSLGRRAYVIQADVAQRTDIRRMLAEAIAAFGCIDILVNNAGINKRGLFHEITDADWDLILDTNLKGPFICCQEIFPHMIEQGGGRIINMSSVASQYHGPKTVHYAVSKAGLNSLTKVLARYGAPHNILINAVAPGQILTDQTRDEFESGAVKPLLDMTLLKRGGSEEDVVRACLYLADPCQRYMTGQVLAVSGGAYLG